MRLNSLKPARGAKQTKTRVGRGIGCGKGKTCGLGHKGQRSRAGFNHKAGFEGGQMPIQRRIPKSGFNSRVSRFVAEVRLSELNKVNAEVIDITALKAANLVDKQALKVKVILSGKITKPVVVKDVHVTKGAKQAIIDAGGTVQV